MNLSTHPTPSTPYQPMAAAQEAAAITPIREFLAFKIGEQEYGMNILCVQEIRSYEKPTAIANMPDTLKGVINLRGVIVPIIDLRLKFGQADASYDHLTVVIVLNIGDRVVGAVVDGVSDVVTLQSEQLRSVPAFGHGFNPDHLLALGSIGERMLILLDIGKLLGTEDALSTYATQGFAAH